MTRTLTHEEQAALRGFAKQLGRGFSFMNIPWQSGGKGPELI